MTETALLALALAGAPSVTAEPYLADKVLAAHRHSRLRRRTGLIALTGMLAVTGTAAARSTGHSRYLAVYEPSRSMGATVAVGESLLADRRLTPAYSDVVAIHLTNDGATFDTISRVVGLPGDVIACPAGPDGRCHAWTRNNIALSEPYAQGSDEVVVPPNRVGPGGLYVLGDQRNLSVDSRQAEPSRLTDVLAVAVAVTGKAGHVRAILGTPAHHVPGTGNLDPATQPTSASHPAS